MTKKAEPLTKFLLPIDGEGTFNSACRLAGSLAASLGDRVEEITLLHVMAGRYLSRHMANIDIRVDYILESETFQRLREDFINKKISPVLKEARSIVQGLYPDGPIDMEIVDGKPAEAIIEFVTGNNYSTIIMQRRCMDPVKGSFIGSVTSGIIYGAGSYSIYIPGTGFPRQGQVRFKTLLIPVDGSSGAQAAVEEAAVIMNAVPDARAVLLHVMDIVDIAKAAEKNLWPSPLQDAEEIIKRTEDLLLRSGIDPGRIEKKILHGDPADIITAQADESDVDIVFLGRMARSAISDIILGSVGRAVLGRCAKKTLAVITPESG